MSDTKYPERGKVSEDGKFYTHVDGSVHENTHEIVFIYGDLGKKEVNLAIAGNDE